MTTASTSADQRIVAIDMLRGIIMVLMALDHTRMYLTNVSYSPLDLTQTSAALFLTRWVTHYCAPLFIFLSGVSTWLSAARGTPLTEAARFLAIRGTLLIVLEIIVLPCIGWNFGLQFDHVTAGVLWAIGWSMIALAGLIHLPRHWVAAIALAMILGHNLVDAIQPESFRPFGWLWRVLHAGGSFNVTENWKFDALYPLVPWIGVMAAGYVFAPLLQRGPSERRDVLIKLGFGLTAAFVLLRAGNFYGDPGPWSAQKDDLFTLLSFINCKKYPPSLLYLLMTIGPGMLLLAWLDRTTPSWLKPVNVFGQVPLFYYIIHLPTIHGLAAALDFGRYHQASWQFAWPITDSAVKAPADKGFGLLIVYLAASFIVCLLYPACRWYAGLKRTHRHLRWIRYL